MRPSRFFALPGMRGSLVLLASNALCVSGVIFSLDRHTVAASLVLLCYTPLIFYEVRKQRALALSLERLQRAAAAGETLSGFAHEMKNSLTVLLGFAELARNAAEKEASPALGEKLRRHLGELEAQTRRANAQLGRFLESSSGAVAVRGRHDLRQVVRDALALIRPMARMEELLVDDGEPEAATEADTATPPRPLAIDCDPFAIEQVLINLLLNAVSFAKSRITIRTAPGADGSVEVAIEDDGPGVPPADRARIFRGHTTREGGSGLGLRVSQEIARAHGGTLELQERAESPGARFVLRLPALD